MRNYKLLAALSLSVAIATNDVHGQAAEWAAQMGSSWRDGPGRLCLDSSGNLYATGRLGSGGSMLDSHPFNVVGHSDIYLLKTSSSGEYIWGTTMGGSPSPAKLYETESGFSTAFDPLTQTIIVCGSYQGESVPTSFGPGLSIQGRGAFVAKYDLDGNCLWVRSTQNGFAAGTLIDEDGTITLLVTSSEVFGISETTFIADPAITLANGVNAAKYASNGSLLWARHFGDQASARCVLAHGEAYLTGILYSGGSVFQMPLLDPLTTSSCVVRVDTGFSNVRWSHTYTGPGTELLEVVDVKDGLLVVPGTSTDSLFTTWDTLVPPVGGRNFFLYGLDTSGTKLWVRQLISTGSAGAVPLVSIAADGSIYCILHFQGVLTVGQTSVTSVSDYDVAVVRLSNAGDLIGLVTGGGFTNGGRDVLAAPDNGCYVSLCFENTIDLGPGFTALGVEDAVVAKLGAITGVGELRVQGQDALHIYANPNTGTCTVDLPDALRLTDDLFLTITDATGRLVQRVPLVYTENGVGIDIRAEARGIYHVELGDGRQRYTGTIVFE